MRLDELLQPLLVALEPLEPLDREKRLLSDHLLPPPQGAPRPPVVVEAPQLEIELASMGLRARVSEIGLRRRVV